MRYDELETTSAEIELNMGTVESERDFYFEKLRGIEVMLQVYKEREDAHKGSGEVERVMESIFKVMYATMDDEIGVDDEGNLIGDITAESSVDGGAAAVAQDYPDDDELLASGLDDVGPAAGAVDDFETEEQLTPGQNDAGAAAGAGDFEAEDERSPTEMHQFASDSDDLDDDELLTSGLDDDGPAARSAVAEKFEPKFNEDAAIVHDDDDFSDDDLLAD